MGLSSDTMQIVSPILTQKYCDFEAKLPVFPNLHHTIGKQSCTGVQRCWDNKNMDMLHVNRQPKSTISPNTNMMAIICHKHTKYQAKDITKLFH